MFGAHVQQLRLLDLWQDRQELRHNQRLRVLLIARDQQAHRRWPKSCWHVSWLSVEQRLAHGMYHQLMLELERNHIPGFVRLMRFEPAMFREMEDRLHDVLVKEDTNMRLAISSAERIAVTLRYLATGETLRSLAFQFRSPWWEWISFSVHALSRLVIWRLIFLPKTFGKGGKFSGCHAYLSGNSCWRNVRGWLL